MQTGRCEFQNEFARKYVALGRSQGEKQGLHRALARQVTVKFGPEALPSVAPQIDNAEVEALEQWLERIVTATTIDDVFGP